VKKLLGGVFGLGLIVVGLVSGRLVRRYGVEGRSMLQAYAPGDRLVVEGVTYWRRSPRIGEVVVVRWPEGPVRPAGSPSLDLKRVAAGPGATVGMYGESVTLGTGEWFVLGDNLDESTDSRELGPVKTADIAGRAWFRY
jgi:signal peptidase I